MTLKIFCDTYFPEEAERMLVEGTRDHELVFAATRTQQAGPLR